MTSAACPKLAPVRPGQGRLALAACLACLLSQAACAETSPYAFGGKVSLGHESNLYRVGDEQLLPPNLKKSDTVTSASVFASLDQTIGRQRIYGSGSLQTNRYQNNAGLNNEGFGLNLGLNWSTIERLSGSLNLSSSQYLAAFENNTGNAIQTTKNLQRNEQADALVRLGLVTRYAMEATLGRRQVSYSAPAYDKREYNENHGSLGLRYTPSGALSFGASLRLTDATYPRYLQTAPDVYVPDTMKRKDIDFTAEWQPSGASELTARLSPTRSSHSVGSLNDFSGLTGNVSWIWQPTGKLKVTTLLSRDTGQSGQAVNVGIVAPGESDQSRTTSGILLRSSYALSAKVGVNASAGFSHRNLVKTVVNQVGVPIANEGTDTHSNLGVGATWTPTRASEVGCGLTLQQVTSNNPTLQIPYKANSVNCFGKLTLQ